MTDDDKKEIKESIDTMTAQYTDFISLVYKALKLDLSVVGREIEDIDNNITKEEI